MRERLVGDLVAQEFADRVPALGDVVFEEALFGDEVADLLVVVEVGLALGAVLLGDDVTDLVLQHVVGPPGAHHVLVDLLASRVYERKEGWEREGGAYSVPRCDPVQRVPRGGRIDRVVHGLLPLVDITRGQDDLRVGVRLDEILRHQGTGEVGRHFPSAQHFVVLLAGEEGPLAEVFRLQGFGPEGVQLAVDIHHLAVEDVVA